MSPGRRRFTVPFRVEPTFCASQASVGLCLSHLGRSVHACQRRTGMGIASSVTTSPTPEGGRRDQSDGMNAHRRRLNLPRALSRMASAHRRLQSVPTANPHNLWPPGVSEPRSEHRVLGLALPGPKFSRPKLWDPSRPSARWLKQRPGVRRERSAPHSCVGAWSPTSRQIAGGNDGVDLPAPDAELVSAGDAL